MDRVANIFMGIVVVAGITTLVAHRNTARILRAGGNVFEGGLRAAMGR